MRLFKFDLKFASTKTDHMPLLYQGMWSVLVLATFNYLKLSPKTSDSHFQPE